MTLQAAPTTSPQDPVATFWTGGWDSTFRVLDLIFHHGCAVQPFYVIDDYRRSTQHELNAMKNIRAALERDHPAQAALLKETITIRKDAIHIPALTTERYNALRSSFEISWQYEWLSAVPEIVGMKTIELCCQAGDHGPHFDFLRANLVETNFPCGARTLTLKDWPDRDKISEGMKLFRAFTFPIINMPKAELDSIARKHGFVELLTHTWFCHYPLGNQPCGSCSPCRHVIDAGFAHRFSRASLLRYRLSFIVHPMRLLLANPDRFLQRIRDKVSWAKAERKS